MPAFGISFLIWCYEYTLAVKHIFPHCTGFRRTTSEYYFKTSSPDYSFKVGMWKVCLMVLIYFPGDTITKLRYSVVLCNINLEKRIRATYSHIYTYSFWLFFSSFTCIQPFAAFAALFCVIDRSSLICLAVTTPVSKLRALCWLLK